MSFGHSIKLFFNNFALVYKSLIFKLICFVVAASLVLTFSFYSIKELTNAGAFRHFLKVFESQNLGQCLVFIRQFSVDFWATLSTVSVNSKICFYIALPLFILLFSFFYGLDKIAINECISAKMSSNLKLSYTGSILSRFLYALKYSLVNLLCFLFSCVIIGLTFILSLNLLSISGLLGSIIPYLIMVMLIIEVTFFTTLFGQFAICCVMNETKVFKGLFGSIGLTFKYFLRNFSLNLGFWGIAIIINGIVINILSGVFLILTLPASIIFAEVLHAVSFYAGIGCRYYLEPQTIVTPKKREHFDKVKKLENII